MFVRSYSRTNHPTAHRRLVPHGAVWVGLSGFSSSPVCTTPGGASHQELHWGWNIRDGFTYMAGGSAVLAEQAGGCLGTSPSLAA